jgi:hypothetical protein
MKEMGMPSSSYAKALREPVHFLWERRKEKNKERAVRFRSKNTVGLYVGSGELRYDHAVPFKYLQYALLELSDITIESVHYVLSQYGLVVFITKEEDAVLNRAALRSKMPKNWDGIDPFFRYKSVGIEIVENINVSN